MFNRFKKWLPSQQYIKSHKSLRLINKYLHDEDLWHITPKSTARGVAIGVFYAFIPLPIQMLLAVITGLIFRANLILSVGLVWLSNPLTMGPMYYACYLLGKRILGMNGTKVPAFHSFSEWLSHAYLIWQPLLAGCLVAGGISGLLGYAAVRLFWTLCRRKPNP